MGSKVRLAPIVAVAALVAGGCDTAAQEQRAPAYETGPDAVPDDILRRALDETESYDGRVYDIYTQARTDLSYLREVEPSNTLGMDDEPGGRRAGRFAAGPFGPAFDDR